MVEITPEIQAQLDAQKKNCIFCKIVSGEMASKKVYEDHLLVGALDINPAAKGHVLLMPKEHYPIMPYIPPATFKHMFGLMAKFVGAAKKTMLRTGANVFIANGGAAGQQSPHFLLHILPRENGDGVDLFAFDEEKTLDEEKSQQINGMLAHNLPLMMRNHFGRNPASWHKGTGTTPDHLTAIKAEHMVAYEDEKTLVVVPKTPQSLGHLVIYSKEEEKAFEALDKESSAHLFYVASFCATAVFEGLGAHGSNIVLKTGESRDNPDGRLSIHVLPRFQGDGINVMWTSMKDKPNLGSVVSAMREETFLIEHSLKEKENKIVIEEPEVEEVVTESSTRVDSSDPFAEITSAIEAIHDED